MGRKEVTAFLSDVLIKTRLSGIGKYWAREVSLDYGTVDVRRIDFLQFCPKQQISIDGIEKGSFIAYEIKSCVEDVFSGNGLNFIAEKNYIVTTMDTWKKLIPKYQNGELKKHVMETSPPGSGQFGIMVAVPADRIPESEFEDPTPFESSGVSWALEIVVPCRESNRKRSMTELLFCMLRAGH